MVDFLVQLWLDLTLKEERLKGVIVRLWGSLGKMGSIELFGG